MKQKYTVESKSNPKLVSAGIILIVINAIFTFSGARDFNISNMTKENVIIELSFLVVGIAFSIWSFIVAKRLNRSGIFWAIFTIVLTPIALIILGTKDIAIQIELRKIFNKYKSEYFLEKLKLEKDHQNGRIDEKMLKEKIGKAKEKYNDLMNNEIQLEQIKIDEKHKEIVIEKVSGNGRAINVKGKCPACETKISDNADECPECGLNFKY
jgi:hypothetical protein